MQPVPTRSRSFAVLVAVPVCAVAIAIVSAQQNTVVPQPVASTLPAPGTASPKPSRPAPKPEGVMPSVPAGFTVSSYAELPSPRMMVYAPNGDLFVSSPRHEHASPCSVTRTTTARSRARGVFAQGGAAAGARRWRRWRAARRRRAAAQADRRPDSALPHRCSAPPRPPCTPPPRVREARTRARSLRRSASRSTTAISTSATPPRSCATSTRTAICKAQGEPEKLMDLPTGGHSTRNIVFNRAGTKMYVAVGSQSNNDAGEDCRRAAILEFNPDGTRLSRLRVGHPQSGRPRAAAGHRHRLDRDERARQPRRRPRARLRDVGEGRRLLRLAVLVHRQELRSALRRRVSRSGQQGDRAGRADPVALGRARHHLLHRHAVPAALSQRRLRRAARIVEPLGGRPATRWCSSR